MYWLAVISLSDVVILIYGAENACSYENWSLNTIKQTIFLNKILFTVDELSEFLSTTYFIRFWHSRCLRFWKAFLWMKKKSSFGMHLFTIF